MLFIVEQVEGLVHMANINLTLCYHWDWCIFIAIILNFVNIVVLKDDPNKQ